MQVVELSDLKEMVWRGENTRRSCVFTFYFIAFFFLFLPTHSRYAEYFLLLLSLFILVLRQCCLMQPNKNVNYIYLARLNSLPTLCRLAPRCLLLLRRQRNRWSFVVVFVRSFLRLFIWQLLLAWQPAVCGGDASVLCENTGNLRIAC